MPVSLPINNEWSTRGIKERKEGSAYVDGYKGGEGETKDRGEHRKKISSRYTGMCYGVIDPT